MKLLLSIPVIILAFVFELIGRVLHQIGEVSMSAAIMLLSAISSKKEG